MPEMFRRFGADEWDALRDRFRAAPDGIARARRSNTLDGDAASEVAPRPPVRGPLPPRWRGEGRGVGPLRATASSIATG